MAQVLDTIEGYIVNIRKKDTIFIGFSPTYAKAWMQLDMSEDKQNTWLDKENVNWNKREEFKQFMAETMPDIKLTDVFDNVPLGYIQWPFLGTIAIDVEIDSPEYHEINNHYEDGNGEPYSLDAVVYIMKYDDALKAYEKRKALEDEEDE
jgi:hypothetical protein